MTESAPEALVFVYNADSGLFNALSDTVHKIISPATYKCSLCRITYGPVKMRDQWKQFLQSLENPVQLIHRDEVQKLYGIFDVELPAIFTKGCQGNLQLWIDAAAINACQSVDDLQALITARLSDKR